MMTQHCLVLLLTTMSFLVAIEYNNLTTLPYSVHLQHLLSLTQTIPSCKMNTVVLLSQRRETNSSRQELEIDTKRFDVAISTVETVSKGQGSFKSTCVIAVTNEAASFVLNNLIEKGNSPFMVLLIHEEGTLLSPSEEQEIVSNKLQYLPISSTRTNFYILFVSKHSHQHDLIKASIWEAFQLGKYVYFNDLSKFKHLYITANERMLQTSLTQDPFQIADRLNRRSNFRGNMIGVTMENDPFQLSPWTVEQKVGGKLKLVGGGAFPWIADLQATLNFTMEIIYGDALTLRNGSVRGKSLEQLNKDEAVLSLSITTFLDYRGRVVTFLQPLYTILIEAFFQQPAANSIRNIVAAPFQPTLWLAFVFTWVVMIGAVKIVFNLQLSPTVPHPGHIDTDSILTDTEFANSAGLWSFAAFCQKSMHCTPNSSTMKIVFICGAMYGVLLYVAYSATVVSLLTTPYVPVQRFEDLITHKFTLTIHNRSEAFETLLKQLIKFYRLSQDVQKVGTEQEVSHLLSPSVPKAFLSYPDLFYQAAKSLQYKDHFVCNELAKVKIQGFGYKKGFFVKKGSEYAEIFNYKLMMLRERGFNFRYLQNYNRDLLLSCLTESDKGLQLHSMDLPQVFTSFLVIFIGCGGALIFLTQEIVVDIVVKKWQV